MTYGEGFIKLAYRLNKSGTADYSNIDKDPASEVINKALSDWLRRTYHGINIAQEGSEESRIRVDDLQPLLVPNRKISMIDRGIYAECDLPANYRYFNRVSFTHTDECGQLIVPSDLREDSNVDVLLNTDGTKPSLDYEQAFHTIASNKIRIYHNKEFTFKDATLSYYRNPKKYDANKESEVFELKDDVMEVVLDEAAKIISGDIESQFQYQRQNQTVEANT